MHACLHDSHIIPIGVDAFEAAHWAIAANIAFADNPDDLDDLDLAFVDAFTAEIKAQRDHAVAVFNERAIGSGITASGEQFIGGNLPADDVFDEAAWAKAIDEKVGPLVEELVIAEAGTAAVGIGIGVEGIANPFLLESAANHIATIDAYQGAIRSHIMRSIEAGLRNGLSVENTAKRIAESGPFKNDFAAARAVAQTELLAARNAGAMATYELAGDGIKVRWIARADSLTRPDHSSNPPNGQVITPSEGELFDVGGEQARHPGATNLSVHLRINCRCAVTPLRVSERLADAARLTDDAISQLGAAFEAATNPIADRLRAERKEPEMADTPKPPAEFSGDTPTPKDGTLKKVTVAGRTFELELPLALAKGDTLAFDLDAMAVRVGDTAVGVTEVFEDDTADTSADDAAGDDGEPAPHKARNKSGLADTSDEISELAAIKDRSDGEVRDDFEWSGPVVFEGIATGDGRYIAEDALDWRKLPLTLMFSKQNMGAHYGSTPAGNMARMEPRTDGSIWSYGYFDSGEAGQEAKRMIKEKTLRGISVDLSALEYVYDFEDDMFIITKARIMGATITPFPAFESAYVELNAGDEALAAAGALRSNLTATFGMPIVALNDDSWTIPAGDDGTPLVAAGGKHKAVFALQPDPKVFRRKDTTDAFRVDGDGVISGLITTWDAVHLSFTGAEIHPPRSKTTYDMLHTPGTMLCADGSEVAVARIFGDMDHVSTEKRIPPEDVAAAYANTGNLLAFVRVYDTEHGIEVAGIMAPGTSKIDAARLRGCDISPDWRPMASLPFGDNLECVALLAVNMSGFNLGLAASGAPAKRRPRCRVAFDEKGGIAAMTGSPTGSPVLSETEELIAEFAARLEKLEIREVERRRSEVRARLDA